MRGGSLGMVGGTMAVAYGSSMISTGEKTMVVAIVCGLNERYKL